MLQLIPVYPMWQLGLVYSYGAKRYEAENWRKGMPWKRVIGCIKRHLAKFENGQDLDDGPQGSGLPHLAHIAFSCFQLMEYSQTAKDFDDRAKNQAQVPA